MGIHNYEIKYQTAIREVQEAPISERNKELIMTFVNDMVLEGLSKPRLIKYHNVLKLISLRLNKDLDKATLNDSQNLGGRLPLVTTCFACYRPVA